MNKTDEALLILAEECAEVIQAISKCQRFGIDVCKPGKPRTNREHLETELGDVIAMIEILRDDLGLVSLNNIEESRVQKREKLKTWSNLFKE
jgi:NTP pyrophosphatase (non-canonical NTP hydrolase)